MGAHHAGNAGQFRALADQRGCIFELERIGRAGPGADAPRLTLGRSNNDQARPQGCNLRFDQGLRVS